jgi:hypothetical protein
MPSHWSKNKLATDCGLDRRTVDDVCKDVAPVDRGPQGDPVYALEDFVAALLMRNSKGKISPLDEVKIKEANINIAIKEVELAQARNSVIPAETAFRTIENVFVAIRREILTSDLQDYKKDIILNALRTLTIDDFLEQRTFDEGTFVEAAEDIHPAGEA